MHIDGRMSAYQAGRALCFAEVPLVRMKQPGAEGWHWGQPLVGIVTCPHCLRSWKHWSYIMTVPIPRHVRKVSGFGGGSAIV